MVEKCRQNNIALPAEFFKREVQKFNKPGISELGKKIIEACLNDASVEEYAKLIPSKK